MDLALRGLSKEFGNTYVYIYIYIGFIGFRAEGLG